MLGSPRTRGCSMERMSLWWWRCFLVVCSCLFPSNLPHHPISTPRPHTILTPKTSGHLGRKTGSLSESSKLMLRGGPLTQNDGKSIGKSRGVPVQCSRGGPNRYGRCRKRVIILSFPDPNVESTPLLRDVTV